MSAQTEANNRWRKKNRTVLQLTITPEEKRMIYDLAEASGISMTAYIMALVKKEAPIVSDRELPEKEAGDNPPQMKESNLS